MNKLLWLLIIVLLLMSSACDVNIERSPDPGILEVVLQADPTDTSIVILGKTYTVDTSSVFNVHVFEAKAYIDSFYTFLVPDLDQFHDPGNTYNILSRKEGTYEKFTIYRSYVPPETFTHLEFGLTPGVMKIADFQIPVELPPDSSVLVQLNHRFTVKENQTTQILIQLEPFRSVVRYRDSYLFRRKLRIVNIRQY